MDYNGAGSMGVMPDSDMKKPKQVYLRNYRKFPLIRSAIERVYKDQGKLRSFSPNGETLNA